MAGQSASTPRVRPATGLTLVAVALAVIVVTGVIVGVAASRQTATVYQPGTPEATVATYLQKLQAGDMSGAYALTISTANPPLSASRFASMFSGWSQISHRASIVSTRVTGDAATVDVDVTAVENGVFQVSDQTRRVSFSLVMHSGAWLIQDPDYLYP